MAGPPRVLLITSRFFLLGEIMTAFKRLGVPYRYINTGDELELDQYLRTMVTVLKSFRPDFALTVNHLGVDHEGLLTGLLSKLDIPLASWFVDNPYLCLAQYSRPQARRTVILTWDADNLEPLRADGFAQVHYLPLASDEERFKPGQPAAQDHPWRARLSFVGNSMVIKTGTRLAEADPSPALRQALAVLAKGFGEHPEWSARAYMARFHPELMADFAALETPRRQLAFETAVIWESTRLYRKRCLDMLMPFAPLIAGDEGWLTTFGDDPRPWRRLPELSYYDDLPVFYPLSDINFNCTSLQMKGAVNQRVFDVPAAGAFLLTDWREQMERLFEPGREVVFYGDPEEIPELVEHYLNHPEERRQVAEAGRARVLAEHTYVRRMSQLLDIMRRAV